MSNNSQIAFTPLGKTVLLAGAVLAPLGIQAPVYAKFYPQNAGQYRITNSAATPIFLGTGATAEEAQANAVAPLAGTPTASIMIMPLNVEIMRFAIDAYFSVVSVGAAPVYITPGQGL